MITEILEANTPTSWVRDCLWQDWKHEPGPSQNAIHGEILHQEHLEWLAIWCRQVDVLLQREPDNPVDPLACLALVDGVEIGHLDAAVAAFFAPTLEASGLKEWLVCGEVVGGYPSAENFGLHLWLNRRLSPGPYWPYWKL